jgi:hypothetical protein
MLPRLFSWEIVSFTNFDLSLKLNFTNALYVSSSAVKDNLYVSILNSNFFKASLD